MSDDEAAPRNRRERRAAAKKDGKPLKQNGRPSKQSRYRTPAEIPMAQPNRSGPQAKTLYEIAEERSALLKHGQPFDKKSEGGKDDDPPIGPLGESLFLTTSLSMVHFTLDVLVYQQYAEEIIWSAIAKRSATIFPVLFVLIYLLHTKTAQRFYIPRQMFHLGLAVGAGCYMIYVGNTYDYFAVMKQAPPLGTLWIWSVIEMKLPFALASIAINAAYLWHKGFTVF